MKNNRGELKVKKYKEKEKKRGERSQSIRKKIMQLCLTFIFDLGMREPGLM